MFEPLAIGSLRLKFPALLAPLAGLTDRGFREQMARVGGVGMFTTEMVSGEGLLRDAARTRRYAEYSENQRPIRCQIFGCEPARMAEAARVIEGMGMDAVDVNMGCPVKKVTATGGGAALLQKPEETFRVVEAMSRAVRIPVTVKMRTGWDEGHVNAPEVARAAEEGGAAAVAVHGRTRAQGYAGKADWGVIARVAQAVRIPVIGNGDLTSPEMLMSRMRESGCAGVMVGRGAVCNPWIFRQAWQLAAEGRYEEPSMRERGAFMLAHLEEMLKDYPPETAARRFRAYVPYYTQGLTHGKRLRVSVNASEDPAEIGRLIREFHGMAGEDSPALRKAG
jgi:tRNA-dihydrouridine synthase B